MSTSIDASDSILPHAIKQSFLHFLVRKTLFLFKLQHTDDYDAMELDAIDLYIPLETEDIAPYPDLITVIKSKLCAFYVSHNMPGKLTTVHYMNDETILLKAYRADHVLRSDVMPQSNETLMSDETSSPINDATIVDTSNDIVSDNQNPAPPDTNDVAQRTLTQGAEAGKPTNEPLDKNDSINMGMFTSKMDPLPQDDPTQNPAPGADSTKRLS